MKNEVLTIKFGGESGQGLNSIGEILTKSLKASGYYIFGYREYPSLIKGGVASYQISLSSKPINSTYSTTDILFCISRRSLHEYLGSVKRGGLIIHSIDKVTFDKFEKELIETNELKILHINAIEESILAGGTKIMSNVFLLGVIWKLLNLKLNSIQKYVKETFGKREDLIQSNINVLNSGFEYPLNTKTYTISKSDKDISNHASITGNDMITIGAYSSGCRALFAYPMTPASSILSTMAEHSSRTGIIVKQVEDEITAVQMALGSMYMGARAFTATSGGGFDLMAETISLSGISEVPLVVVLAQRPGPATGLPTWTAAGDLNLAIYSGHGEFPRIVLSVSDAISSYTLIQEAFNLAEVYQVPVILLTDKHIAESVYTVDSLPESVPINRGELVEKGDYEINDFHRYQITDSGVSPRWFPGTLENLYVTNSDEHDTDGYSTESMNVARSMHDKRMSKIDTILEELPDPILHGESNPDLLIVGWGSVKDPILDAITALSDSLSYTVGYLHYEYLFPLKTERLQELMRQAKMTTIIENNSTAQLAGLISQTSNANFDDKLLKYDGRPFFKDDIVNYLTSISVRK